MEVRIRCWWIGRWSVAEGDLVKGLWTSEANSKAVHVMQAIWRHIQHKEDYW
jgi:hypothetical protein